MSPFVVSFLFSAGAGTWIYTKFQRYSGNNTKQSVMAAGFSTVLIFIVFYFLTKSIL